MVTGAFWHRTHRLIAQPQPEKLRDSKFGKPKYLEAFSKRFDDSLKKVFPISDSREDQFVKIGAIDKNDSSCGISRGLLKLTG